MSKRVNTDKIILGIDPGTNVMGYGVIRVNGNKAGLIAMGVIDMRKMTDPYLKLGRIFDRVTGVIQEYLPDEMAIEAPFFGKNVQSMLKLGRAQGVAIAIKMAITGQGDASKEQVAGMLQRLLKIEQSDMPKFLDATDALGAAYCHFLQSSTPQSLDRHYGSWKDFVNKNRTKVSGL